MAGEQQQRFQRAPIHKMFAAELKDTTIELQKNSDDQYEKQYFLLPSGVAVSKVMVVGTAVEKEDIGDREPFWRIRVADATGAIMVYAGQYQPEAAQMIAGLQIPCFVAVVGKPSVYRPEGGPVVSIRPDSIVIVDEATRSSFIVDAARQLIARATALKTHPETVMAQKALAEYPNISANELLGMADGALKSLLAPEGEKSVGADEPTGVDKQVDPAPEAKPEDKKETPPAAPEKPKDKKAKKETPGAPPAKAKPKQGVNAQSTGATVGGDAAEPFGGGIKELADIIEEILRSNGVLNAGGITKALKEKGITTYVQNLEDAIKLLKQEGRISEPKLGAFRAE